MKTIKLITGTNEYAGERLLQRKFKDLSWWSDNLETAAHYYEGKIIEITVYLDEKKDMGHVSSTYELAELGMNISEYTYGSAEVKYPKGATWYTFGQTYLEKHVLKVEEIFPDLKPFNEEGTGY